MRDELAGVVLAAGAGTRLAPLTRQAPKALVPVGNVPLVDHALARVAPETSAVAVNLHHHAAQLERHLPASVHRSHEAVALGTAGALGALRSWIDGRPVLVTNADAWFAPGLDLREMVDAWDRDRTRLLCVRDPGRGDFGPLRYCGVALIPAATAARFAAEPSGLYEVSWRAEAAAGRLDLVETSVPFVDCGTPADYLRANLLATGGANAVADTAVVDPTAVLRRCVVWPGAAVAAREVLVDAIRAPGLTVLVRTTIA